MPRYLPLRGEATVDGSLPWPAMNDNKKYPDPIMPGFIGVVQEREPGRVLVHG
jgi:hypothetical protein